MNKYIFLFLLILSSSNSLVCSQQNEKPIISVNDMIITNGELNYELGRLEEQAMIQGEQREIPLNYAHFEELRAQVIEMLIVKKLLLKECEKRSISIPGEKINEQLLILKTQFPSEKHFRDFLDYSNITEDKLRKEIDITLSIDALAEQLIGNQHFSSQEKKEQQKQQALSILVDKLYKSSKIIYFDR